MSLFRPVPPGNWSLFFSASAMLAREEEADETAELLHATWTTWLEHVPDEGYGDAARIGPGRLPGLRAARGILPDLRDFPQVFIDPLEAVDRLASLAALLGRVRAAVWSEKLEAGQARAISHNEAHDHFSVHTADIRAIHDEWAPGVRSTLDRAHVGNLNTHIPGYLDHFSVIRCAESIVNTARILHQAVTETAAAVAFLDLDAVEGKLVAYDAAEQRSRAAAGLDEYPWELLRLLRYRVQSSLDVLDGGYADLDLVVGARQELWEVGLDLEEAVLGARADGTEHLLTACSAYLDVLEALQVARITLDRHPVQAPGWQPEPMDVRFPARVAEQRNGYLEVIDVHLAGGREALARAENGWQESHHRRDEDARLPGTLRTLHARLQVENRRQGPIFTTIRMEVAQERLLETAGRLEKLLDADGSLDGEPDGCDTLSFTSMSPGEFEDAVAALLRGNGCTAERNGGAGDLGADVVGTTPRGSKIVVQCKRYDIRRPVGSPDMQRFAGTCFAVHRADLAAFVTTSTFTDAAASFAAEVGITLVDGEKLRAWEAGVYNPVDGI